MKTEQIEEFRALLRSQGVSTELCDLAHDHNRALDIVRFRGVPESRARYLSQALDVLLTRLDREAQALRAGTRIAEHRLEEIDRQVIYKTEDMPEGVIAWERDGQGDCIWWMRLERGVIPWKTAPNILPDEHGPLFLPIIDAPDAGGEG